MKLFDFDNLIKGWDNRFGRSTIEEKATSGIAEPIISFVECFKGNTKRFKMRTYAGELFYITDTLCGKEYVFGRGTTWNSDKEKWFVVRFPFEISQKDVDYICDSTYSEYLYQKESEHAELDKQSRELFESLYKLGK